jgi:hypothetical protein
MGAGGEGGENKKDGLRQKVKRKDNSGYSEAFV